MNFLFLIAAPFEAMQSTDPPKLIGPLPFISGLTFMPEDIPFIGHILMMCSNLQYQLSLKKSVILWNRWLMVRLANTAITVNDNGELVFAKLIKSMQCGLFFCF